MANGIDFSRLRRQNLFSEIPDLSGGTMGNINLDVPDFDVDPGGYITEGPQRPSNNYQMGQVNLPNVEFDRQVNDPRAPINPSIGQQPIAGPDSRGATEADNLLDIINSLYTPETTSRDRFNRLLDAAPERESPGIMRGLAAFGMGLGAKDPLDVLKVHEQAMYAPHHRAMADWTAKTQPFGQAAQFENTANINERTLAGNVGTNIVNQQRYDQQNAINEEKNRIAQEKAESDRIRAQAYDFKQRNPDWVIKTDGPRVMAYNPADPSQRPIDLGASGNMTEADKINLQNAGRIEASKQMGANAATVAGINQSERWVDRQGNVYNLNPNQVGDAETMGLRPISPGAPAAPRGPITPVDPSPPAGSAQQPRIDRNNRFQQLADERPDLAAKWLIPPASSTGSWGIKPPPTGRDGWLWDTPVNPVEMQEYNQVRQALGLPPMPQQALPQQQAPAQRQPVTNPGIGPSVTPAPPQAATPPPPPMVDPMTQPQEYTDPFAQPPIQPGQRLGTPSEIIGDVRGSLRPPPPSQEAQVASEVAKGTRLTVTDPTTGQVIGSIPNDPVAIDAATKRGLRVDVR